MNTWPNGIKKALDQSQHEQWNSFNYPGTRQVCCVCDALTGNCEEDAYSIGDEGPFCEDCFKTASEDRPVINPLVD